MKKEYIWMILMAVGILVIIDLNKIKERFYLTEKGNARLNLALAKSEGLINVEAAKAYQSALDNNTVRASEVTKALSAIHR